jgi:amino-acid N-acetyltransferase
MELTLARPGDEAQVKELLAECELPSQDITSAHLEHFWVLRDGPRLAGVVGLEFLDSVALLRSLAVPVGYRGRGIGSQLTQAAEAYARSRQVEALYLLTTTAEAFFARQGYGRIERPPPKPSLPGKATGGSSATRHPQRWVRRLSSAACVLPARHVCRSTCLEITCNSFGGFAPDCYSKARSYY